MIDESEGEACFISKINVLILGSMLLGQMLLKCSML
jgi:hypothetical protein